MSTRIGIRVPLSILLFQLIVIPSCEQSTRIEATHTLIVELTATPERVVRGGDVTVEMVLWNNTNKEILIEETCCWTFQVFTSDMQELPIFWICPTSVCLTRRLMPGERMRRSEKFPTLIPSSYAEYWPSDDGKLPAGEYIVISQLGYLKSDPRIVPFGQVKFEVVKPR